MTRAEHLKMLTLAVLIALALTISGGGKDRLGQVEPVLLPAPPIETQILAG